MLHTGICNAIRVDLHSSRLSITISIKTGVNFFSFVYRNNNESSTSNNLSATLEKVTTASRTSWNTGPVSVGVGSFPIVRYRRCAADRAFIMHERFVNYRRLKGVFISGVSPLRCSRLRFFRGFALGKKPVARDCAGIYTPALLLLSVSPSFLYREIAARSPTAFVYFILSRDSKCVFTRYRSSYSEWGRGDE